MCGFAGALQPPPALQQQGDNSDRNSGGNSEEQENSEENSEEQEDSQQEDSQQEDSEEDSQQEDSEEDSQQEDSQQGGSEQHSDRNGGDQDLFQGNQRLGQPQTVPQPVRHLRPRQARSAPLQHDSSSGGEELDFEGWKQQKARELEQLRGSHRLQFQQQQMESAFQQQQQRFQALHATRAAEEQAARAQHTTVLQEIRNTATQPGYLNQPEHPNQGLFLDNQVSLPAMTTAVTHEQSPICTPVLIT
ncbi:MAG: hypothetical protein EBU90_30430 [Proteobacteria bacterium]|nr:hypothetical protein [Pseudomonadota bacterium]NBP16867.1 hypothetical protein [bacterium]